MKTCIKNDQTDKPLHATISYQFMAQIPFYCSDITCSKLHSSTFQNAYLTKHCHTLKSALFHWTAERYVDGLMKSNGTNEAIVEMLLLLLPVQAYLVLSSSLALNRLGGWCGIHPQAGSSLCCAETVSSRKLKLCDFYYILISFDFEYKQVP